MMNDLSVNINRPIWQFDYVAINRDFKFLCLERTQGGNWYGAHTLDKALSDFQAKAVLFAYGKMAFLMFDAQVDIYSVKHQLRNQEELKDCKIYPIQAQEPAQNQQPSIYGKWLAQIFLNSLVSNSSLLNPEPINNLGGRFYWLAQKAKSHLTVLEVEFAFDESLRLKAKNFSKQSAGWLVKKPQYNLEKHRFLKRVFSVEIQDQKLETFVAKAKQFHGNEKKAHLPFLVFNTLVDFEQSKIGIWSKIHRLINRHLSHYLTLELEAIPTIQRIKLKKAPTLLQRLKALPCKRIVLIDEVRSTQSQQVIEQIQKLIHAQAIASLDVALKVQSQPEALNIRLVYPKDYYQQENRVDPYHQSNPSHAVQHLYLNTWQATAKEKTQQAILSVCLKEAQLKLDFIQKQLHIFDWKVFAKRHKIDQAWSFLSPILAKKEQRQQKSIQPQDILGLNKITVLPNGQLQISQINDAMLLDATKQHSIEVGLLTQFREHWQAKPAWLGELKGFIYLHQNQQLLGFYQSRLFPLPNYAKIHQRLEQVNQSLPKGWQTPQDWQQKIHTFLKQNLHLTLIQKTKFNQLIQCFNEMFQPTEKLTKKEVRPLFAKTLSKNSKEFQLFDSFLTEHDLYFRFSKNEQSVLAHIPSQVELNLYQKKAFIGYALGVPKGEVQATIDKANPIRWIQNIKTQDHQPEIPLDAIIELLNIDFVQASQNGSVLPFFLGNYLVYKG